MIPDRDKPKRISLRPIAAMMIAVIGVVMLIGRGGSWRTAGYVVGVLTVITVLGIRILGRRIQRAREPDPQSTLKI